MSLNLRIAGTTGLLLVHIVSLNVFTIQPVQGFEMASLDESMYGTIKQFSGDFVDILECLEEDGALDEAGRKEVMALIEKEKLFPIPKENAEIKAALKRADNNPKLKSYFENIYANYLNQFIGCLPMADGVPDNNNSSTTGAPSKDQSTVVPTKNQSTTTTAPPKTPSTNIPPKTSSTVTPSSSRSTVTPSKGQSTMPTTKKPSSSAVNVQIHHTSFVLCPIFISSLAAIFLL